jgi:IclR family acetate operon transcriptional repressor
MARPAEISRSPTQIRAVNRAFLILDVLARKGPTASLTEMSESTHLDVSTCLRFLSSLEEVGVVRKDQKSKTYGLGPKLVYFADRFLRMVNVQDVVKRHLERLVQITEETAFYTIRNGDYRVTLYSIESPHDTIAKVNVGLPMALSAGSSGRAIMSYLREEEIERFLSKDREADLQPKEIIKPTELKKEILKIRAKGYAVRLREPFPTSNSVAAPVFDSNGVIGSIAIIGPAERLTSQLCERFGPTLKEIAQGLSGEMGWDRFPAKSSYIEVRK